MKRWGADFWVCCGVAPLWGLGASLTGDAAGWNPLIASASPLVLLAAFGWIRRGRELLDVFAPAVGVAYAAFIGLALARAVDSNLIAATYNGGAMHRMVPITSWPLILVAGIAYAFAFAIFAALPASMLAGRPKVDPAADARFWAFVRDHTQPDERMP